MKGKLGGCLTSIPGIVIPDYKSSFNVVLTNTTANDCSTFFTGGGGISGTITFTWKTEQAIEPKESIITFDAGDVRDSIYSVPCGPGMPNSNWEYRSAFPT